ncbi:MAG: iron-containing alcohol dehydrogenase [Oscillospiraceae bacterium]
MNTTYLIPKKIISGKGALEAAKDTLAQMGNKALIVTGPVVLKLDCLKRLCEVLEESGVDYSIYSEITGEPTDVMINEGLKVFNKQQCDFLIGIGGGSPLDSIKAIAAVKANGGKISDFMGKTINGDFVPMVAIPTTAGTGSEATQFTVITDTETEVKMLLKGEKLIPDLAIIEPEFTVSSPKSITASTGLDALTHAVESYTSRKAQSLTDTVCEGAVKKIFKYLPRAYKNGNDLEAREQMAFAALEAGFAINNASVTIVHGMSRPIGALFHVPHGLSNAMLLTKCMSFAVDGAYKKFANLGRLIGVANNDTDDKTSAESFIFAIDELCKTCEVPTLEEYGIDRLKFFDNIDKMASDAIASGSPSNTIKQVSKENIVKIYKSLWD